MSLTTGWPTCKHLYNYIQQTDLDVSGTSVNRVASVPSVSAACHDLNALPIPITRHNNFEFTEPLGRE